MYNVHQWMVTVTRKRSVTARRSWDGTTFLNISFLLLIIGPVKLRRISKSLLLIRKMIRKPPPHLYSRFNSSTLSKTNFFLSSLFLYQVLTYPKSSSPWHITRLINLINEYCCCRSNKQFCVGTHFATVCYFQRWSNELCLAAAPVFAL